MNAGPGDGRAPWQPCGGPAARWRRSHGSTMRLNRGVPVVVGVLGDEGGQPGFAQADQCSWAAITNGRTAPPTGIGMKAGRRRRTAACRSRAGRGCRTRSARLAVPRRRRRAGRRGSARADRACRARASGAIVAIHGVGWAAAAACRCGPSRSTTSTRHRPMRKCRRRAGCGRSWAIASPAAVW